MKENYFSLVVATFNRVQLLEKFIQSLLKQKFSDFILIVVNQGPDSEIQTLFKKYNSLLNIKLLQSEKGASLARNVGIREAKGRYIGFPDDDCEYSEDYLFGIHKILKQNPSWDGISGIARNKDGELSLLKLHQTKLEQKISLNRKNAITLSLEPTIFAKNHCLQETNFDINMGVGAPTPWQSDEGPDLIIRLLKKNKIFYFCPSNAIIHPTPNEATKRRAFSYACGRGYLCRKHLFLLPTLVYLGLKALCGSLLFFSKNRSKHKERLKGYVKGFFKIQD